MRLLLTAGTLSLMAACLPARAQQLPSFGRLQDEADVLNPAALTASFLRFGHNLRFAASYHDRWTQFEGHPRTAALTAGYVADGFERVTPHLGLVLVSDQTGPTGYTGAYARFAGIVSGDPYEGGISLGLQAGFSQYRVDFARVRLREEEPLFLEDNDGRLYPDVGAGLFAYRRLRENVYYAGVSSPQLLSLEVGFEGRDSTLVTERYRHFYAQAGAVVEVDDGSYLEPVVWVRNVPGVPTHVSASVRYQSDMSVFLGVGASSTRALRGELGVLVGDADQRLLRVGYGFDYTFQGYGQFAGAAHEFHLGYSLYR